LEKKGTDQTVFQSVCVQQLREGVTHRRPTPGAKTKGRGSKEESRQQRVNRVEKMKKEFGEKKTTNWGKMLVQCGGHASLETRARTKIHGVSKTPNLGRGIGCKKGGTNRGEKQKVGSNKEKTQETETPPKNQNQKGEFVKGG